MAACAEVISPLAFYGAPKSQLYAVLSCKNYFPPHFSFLGSLPVSIASAPERAEQLSPVGPASSGLGSLATPGSPAQSRPPSAARGSRGDQEQQERLQLPRSAAVGRGAEATVPRHVEGRGEPAFPPGTAFSGLGREGGSDGGTAGLPCSADLAGRGGEGWGTATEQQKIDLKVQEVRKQWLSLPRQPVLTRRLHVGGKLQTSVENSNTPSTSNDKRNNNDNSDNVFPYIKAKKINILLHPLPPWSPDLLKALSFQYFGGWSRFERGTLSGRVKAGGDVTRVPFTFSREHNHCPCDKNLCYGLGAVEKRELCRSVS